MNKRSFYPIAALLGAPLIASLSSCSDELGMNNAGKTINLTVTASKDANTRTYFEPEGRDLFSKWDDNDMIVVTNAVGKQVGVMTISAGAGNSTATFSGKVEYNGDETLNFLYLGNDSKAEATAEGYNISIASQISAIANLTDFDAMSKSAKIEVAGDEGTAEIGEMNRTLAFARFTLTNLELAAGDKVTVSGKNLRSSFTLTSKGEVIKANTDGSISVTIPQDATNANDIYMAVLPLDNDSITPTFTVSKNGKTYKGSLKARLWTQSEYVNVSATEGVEVAMEEYNDPYAGYENEDPRNPLHIFAKYNLTRKGDATAWENVFADSETENGALYQWGRNYGYMDIEGKDFTNYIDAMGKYTHDYDNEKSYYDYFVYDPSNICISGTGGHLKKGVIVWQDTPSTYSTIEDIKSHTTSFFMSSIEEYDGFNHYWIWNGGGRTWKERAEACGYPSEKLDPCPKGWRLPTASELSILVPSKTFEANNNSLSYIFQSNGVEIRTDNAKGIRYAIKWTNSKGEYVRIDALVLDDSSIKYASQVNWDDPNVVTRYFQTTGAIDYESSCIAKCSPYGSATVVVPTPRHNPKKVGAASLPINVGEDGIASDGGFIWEIAKYSFGSNYNSQFGGYWAGDSQKALKFVDRYEFEAWSYLECTLTETTRGLAIRPVMDK